MSEDWKSDEAETVDDLEQPEVTDVPAVAGDSWADDSGPLPVLDEEDLLSESDIEAPDEISLTECEPPAPVDVAPDAGSILSPTAPREMDLGPEKRVRWWPWALAGLVVLLVLGSSGYGWWWLNERPIVIPDVVGKRPAEATQVLNNVDLRLGRVSEVPTDSAPAGTIVGQKPEAGGELKPGGQVSFVLAAAPEQTKIPNVVGVSTSDAARILAQFRLRYIPVESYSETVAAGFVVSQLPTVGVELPPGGAVALVVSKGMFPAARAVPGLAGLAEGDAIKVIEASGLVARVSRSIDPSITAGVVLEQYPTPRASAAYGSNVLIVVSKGALTGGVRVPNMSGDTRKEAVEKLKAKRLKPTIVMVANPSVPKGRVLAQMPSAGRSVAPAATVDLVVSSGPATVMAVPSVIGTLSAGASGSIEASGFASAIVTIEMADVPYGTVIAQFPPAGTMWTLRYPVVCLVAEAPRP